MARRYSKETQTKKGAQGAAWAEKVWKESVTSGKGLPNLGKGYPVEYRAAYKVRAIAERKQCGRMRTAELRFGCPDPFWKAVYLWASTKLGDDA